MLTTFQPPRGREYTPQTRAWEGVFPGVIHKEHAVAPKHASRDKRPRFPLRPQRNPDFKASQPLGQCSLPAESLYHSPMSFPNCVCLSSPFREGWQRMLRAAKATPPSLHHVWCNRPCVTVPYPQESIHDGFSALRHTTFCTSVRGERQE